MSRVVGHAPIDTGPLGEHALLECHLDAHLLGRVAISGYGKDLLMIMYKIFSGLGVALMRYQVSMPEVMAFVARGV